MNLNVYSWTWLYTIRLGVVVEAKTRCDSVTLLDMNLAFNANSHNHGQSLIIPWRDKNPSGDYGIMYSPTHRTANAIVKLHTDLKQSHDTFSLPERHTLGTHDTKSKDPMYYSGCISSECCTLIPRTGFTDLKDSILHLEDSQYECRIAENTFCP